MATAPAAPEQAPETRSGEDLSREEASRASAEEAGLRYVGDDTPGITRRKTDRRWAYFDPKGARITDRKTIDRINTLAIPPAYTDVWICPNPRGHIQATGRDAKGRKQYRYHEKYREARDSNKYTHMLAFAETLPAIRAAVERDMAKRGLPREKVLATIVRLLEQTMIRVGNDEYSKANKSFGLTTLRDRHVDVEGSELKFRFKGKSGKSWDLKLKDRRVARIVRQSQDLPGQRLFQYLDADGERHEVTSGDVNRYLREISGQDITAKDFRTWTGTVLAALALAAAEEADSETAQKRTIKRAIEQVAATLGNTPTICRKCYVHPEVFNLYLDRALAIDLASDAEEKLAEGGLDPAERAVLDMLKTRLQTNPAV